MSFFTDYVWFRIYNFYRDRNESGPVGSATVTLGAIQGCNILTLYIPLYYFHGDIFVMNKMVAVSIYTVLVILNSIRFRKNKIKALDEQWKNEQHFKKVRKGWFVLSYLILSLVIVLSAAALTFK